MPIYGYIVLGTGLIIVAILIAAAVKSPDFRIERSTTINAPSEVVFANVNDFHSWGAWSPWEKMDPNLQRTYEGPSSGVGAKYGWVGNKQVGEGRMTITESNPPNSIRIKLEFLKPFTATNTAGFDFKPQGSQTQVVWSMTGHQSFVMRIFCLFMNMDKMVGKDFEKGLAQMKAVSEGAAQPA